MTQPSLRPPPTLQPRPKAVPTFSSASVGAISRSSTPRLSRPSSQSRHPSPTRNAFPTDTSDRAITALIRRVLCPHAHSFTEKERPIDELLPPLTSSNDVDLQLYAIIAIVVKDLVQSWYSKITPDQTFVEEVVKIIAHCTRALESRLRHIDIEHLILDEIPGLVDRHIQGRSWGREMGWAFVLKILAFRISHGVAQSQDLSTDPRTLYHNLIPHPALAPIPNIAELSAIEEQAKNESNYRRLLAQGALAVLLPTEDLENACLRTLVADVFAEPILGNSIGGKVCESWFIWNSITKLTETVKAQAKPKATSKDIEVDARSRLERFGLLSAKEEKTARSSEHGRSGFSSLIWRTIQYFYLAAFITRSIVVGLFAAHSEPRRSSNLPKPARSAGTSPLEASFDSGGQARPILSFGIFGLLSTIIDLPHRMPWLAGMLALSRHHLSQGRLSVVGGRDAILDQYLHHLLHTQLVPATLLPKLLAHARQTLFPGNALPPSPSPPPPSPEQVEQIRLRCARSVIDLLPPALCRRLLGPDDKVWEREVGVELDVWGDSWMNKHLGYRILELCVVRVLPELGEKGVRELMEGRLGPQDIDSV